jgi:hypothetical protein
VVPPRGLRQAHDQFRQQRRLVCARERCEHGAGTPRAGGDDVQREDIVRALWAGGDSTPSIPRHEGRGHLQESWAQDAQENVAGAEGATCM